MEKVIYINYMKQLGHLHFDQIQIDALVAQGYDVKLVMHQEIALQLPYPKEMYALVLPSWTDTDSTCSLTKRISYVLALHYIKRKINFSRFDHILISNLDEVTLGIYPLTKGMYMICHGNSNDFSSRIKTYFLNRLARQHNTFLVFNEEMAKPFRQNGISKTAIISHGCFSPFKVEKESRAFAFIEEFSHVVFHPSSKTAGDFVAAVYTESMNQTLKASHTLLLLRDLSVEDRKYSNIHIIHGFLSEADYQYLFVKAHIILLAYPAAFSNQVSGVSYECVANQKKMLIWHNPSLAYCKTYYEYDPFVETAGELVEKMFYLTHTSDNQMKVDARMLTTNFSRIFTNNGGCIQYKENNDV